VSVDWLLRQFKDKHMIKRSFIIIGLSFVLAMMMWLQKLQKRNARLEQQVASLPSQIAAGEATEQDNGGMEKHLKTVTEQAEGLDGELARLRSEATALRNENAELKLHHPVSSAPPPPRHPTEVAERQPYRFTPEQSDFFVERLDFGKRLGLAFRTLAEENNGQLPEDLTRVAKWLATNNVPIAGDTGPLFGVGVKSFELVYKGNLNDLPNPEQVILAREVNPVEVHAERWNRMYVFADGSVQRLEATSAGGFEDREKEIWPGQP
jgi:hypothetical protein